MSWAKAHIEIRSASVGTGIKVSMKRTNKSSARMTFTISDATGKSFGWAGGDKVEVMLGEGEHHGLLRLRKNNSAGQAELSHREMAKGAWFTLKLGHQHSFVDRSEPALWCQWEKVEDGWIEIVLPKWADETGPKARKDAVVTREHRNEPPDRSTGPRAVEASPAARSAKQSVTAAVMGDPPAGRREMLAQIGKIKA